MGRFRLAGVDVGKRQDPPALCMLERQTLDEGFHGPVDERIAVVAMRQWPLDLDYTVLVDEILGYNPDAFVVEVNGVGEPIVDLMRRQARIRSYRGRIHGVVTAGSNVRPKLVQDDDAKGGRRVIIPKDQLVYAINVLERKGKYVECKKCGAMMPALDIGGDAVLCTASVKKRHMATGDITIRPCGGTGVRKGSGLIIPDLMQKAWHQCIEQMKTFDQKQNAAGGVTFDQGGTGHHADLVMAMGMAAWWVNKFFFTAKKRELALV